MYVVKRHLRNSQQSPPAVPTPVEDLIVPQVSIQLDGSRSCRDTGRDAVEKRLKHLSECLTRTLSLKLLNSPAKSIANVFTNTWLVFIFKSQHLKPLLSSLFLFICYND